MEKNVEVSILLDFYGALLKEKHFFAVDLYCNSDLSLSETSQELGITRQGARDLIKRAETALYEYEEKLGLYKRYRTNEKLLSQLRSELQSLEEKADGKFKEQICKIKNITEQFSL